MNKEYIIEGMTCKGCVAKVKQSLENLNVVKAAEIRLDSPQASIILRKPVNINLLQDTIGKYTIKEYKKDQVETTIPEKSLTTYKPLLLIVSFIIGVSLLVQYPFADFSPMLWMRHFMAGFFLVFSFFKLLNIRGFANSYAMYDIVAAKSKVWGYIYPFVELGLGVLYLINLFPVFTNWTTIIVLGISSIGVVRSVFNQEKIKCACLGDVFNLPMSTVTIVEDVTMVLMAGVMLYLM